MTIKIAKAAGARVIATTSSPAKAERLRQLGADHVLDYTQDPHWGQTARSLTPEGAGVDHVIEVGGPTTMTQSLEAIRIEGLITVIGFLGGARGVESPSFLLTLQKSCTVRGTMVGSRVQFEQLNRAIEANQIEPVVDATTFELKDLKAAYQYMVSGVSVGMRVRVDADFNPVG